MRLHGVGRARMRAVVGLGAVVLAAVAGGAGAVPATAVPVHPPELGLTVSGGDAQISAAWSAVPGATGYAVHWGLGSRTDHVALTTATSMRISGVRNRSGYSVRVSAVGSAVASGRRAVRPVPYVPLPIRSVRAVPDGEDRIRVSWSGGGQARSVRVLAGADSITDAQHFGTGWMPAAVRSTVLRIPRRLQGVLGADTGNVVFVKVAQSNSRGSVPSDPYRFSLADKYRLTPSGTWSLAGRAAAPGSFTPLTVATWNVQSVTASATYAARDRWDQRLPKVVRNIETHAPQLIGLQELTTARIRSGCLNHHDEFDCVEQYQTLETALRTAPTPYLNARSDADAWVYSHPGSYVDSDLFYDPAALVVQDSGFISPRDLPGVAWPAALANEAGVWARFGILDPTGHVGRSFLAVSIHLPVGDWGSLRRAEAAAIARSMDEKALRSDGTSLPVVFTGDFNSDGARQPDAGSLRLVADGYLDAAATGNRTNLDFSTANETNGVGGTEADYPVRVTRHPYPTSRIDYVMLKNSPYAFAYRNLVPIAGDRFDSSYQGSDHNMQLASVGIGDPVG